MRKGEAQRPELLNRLCSLGRGPDSGPRAMIVVAHPDDEVIGAGSRLPLLPGVVIVHVTDGAPRSLADARAAGFDSCQSYARARRQELYAALALAGIGPEQTREIGLPDQEASLHMGELAHTLCALVRREQPEFVLTHPYEGGHPDHDATAFAVQAACRMLGRQGGPAPVVVEMTSYFNRDGILAVCDFLPSESGAVKVPLTLEEQALKERMRTCFITQQEVLGWFRWDVECFRLAPRYRFTEAPHDGVLHYEQYDWGMDGARWRALALEAARELGIDATDLSHRGAQPVAISALPDPAWVAETHSA